MKRLLLAATAYAIFGSFVILSAQAQIAPSPPPTAVQGGNATLAVTTSSARVALPSALATYPVVLVINTGASDAFVTFGTVAVTAALTNTPVPAGHALALWNSAAANLYIAAIGAGSTSLYIVQFNGTPFYR